MVKGDIRDAAKLGGAIRKADAIFHLASVVGYPACNRDAELAQEVNVGGTRLLNRLRSADQPIMFASTGSNYGPVPSGVCTEDLPLNPRTLYARTKAEAENILLEKSGVVVYRLATAFGLSPALRLDLLVNDFCYKAVHKGALVVYEANAKRTFIDVYDIARAFLHALENLDRMRDGIYNCGDDRMNASKLEVAQLIQRQVDCVVKLADVGTDEDQRDYEVSYNKISATGYRTTISLEEGISRMIAAFRFLPDASAPIKP